MRIDGGAGVREVGGEDFKAPWALKPVTGVIGLLKKTQSLGMIIKEVEELDIGTLGSMHIKLKAQDMGTRRSWHQGEEGKVGAESAIGE